MEDLGQQDVKSEGRWNQSKTFFCPSNVSNSKLKEIESINIDKMLPKEFNELYGKLRSTMKFYQDSLEGLDAENANYSEAARKELLSQRQRVEYAQILVNKLSAYGTAVENEEALQLSTSFDELFLPTKLCPLAESIGLEVFNSIKDDGKLYFSTQKLLIEVSYFNKNSPTKDTSEMEVETPVESRFEVTISYTENEKEVKMKEESLELQKLLSTNATNENFEELKKMLQTLMLRTSSVEDSNKS